MKPLRAALLALAHLAAILLPSGCEIDSADTFSRDVPVDFSGFYTACSGNLVGGNSGASITTLDLRQSGDRLEAVDNNGSIWRGSLGEVQNGRSTFELKGRTTTDTEGIFSGTLSSSDAGSTNSSGAADGSMRGTYIEPGRFSSFCGNADIPGSSNGGGSGGTSLAISPSSDQSITTAGGAISFTASGGNGTYTWTISDSSLGALSASSGSSVTYTRSATAVGTQTLTLGDGSNTRSVSIAQSN